MNDIPTRAVVSQTLTAQENNAIPEVSISNSSTEDRLLSFVEQQIEKMRKYSTIGCSDGIPGFYELNNALLEFTNIQTSLISLDVMAKIELDQATEAFKDWQAEKYMEARAVLNPLTLSAQKWYSSSELDMYVRSNWKDEYSKLHKNMAMAEMKVASIRRLLDTWNNQSLVLNRLSKNVEVEMLSMHTGSGLGLNN